MPLYTYKKGPPEAYRRVVTVFSYSIMVIGALFLFWSFYPIIHFKIYSSIFIGRDISRPVPENDTASAILHAQTVNNENPKYSTNLSDYTKVNVWFPSLPQEESKLLDVEEYTLSIPSLNIENAKVIIGGTDLKKGLIHYAAKSLPGRFGNVSIFGHSTLPVLAQTGSDHFESIFTYLPTIKTGAKVIAKVDDEKYEYEVFDTFIVKPEDIWILNQENDDSYMTIVTCTPPGTYIERFVAKARLVD